MTNGETIRTRVLIVDARRDVREALTALLDACGDFEVVGECCAAADATGFAATLAPDIVVLDPDGRFDHDALVELAARPGSLVILTLRDGRECRSRAQTYGAVVVDKGTTPEALLATLRGLMRAGR